LNHAYFAAAAESIGSSAFVAVFSVLHAMQLLSNCTAAASSVKHCMSSQSCFVVLAGHSANLCHCNFPCHTSVQVITWFWACAAAQQRARLLGSDPVVAMLPCATRIVWLLHKHAGY
jgi:hypothetical protein